METLIVATAEVVRSKNLTSDWLKLKIQSFKILEHLVKFHFFHFSKSVVHLKKTSK